MFLAIDRFRHHKSLKVVFTIWISIGQTSIHTSKLTYFYSNTLQSYFLRFISSNQTPFLSTVLPPTHSISLPHPPNRHKLQKNPSYSPRKILYSRREFAVFCNKAATVRSRSKQTKEIAKNSSQTKAHRVVRCRMFTLIELLLHFFLTWGST